uniref:Vascular endothelial growth factor C n=2 Tax=Saccoglossus kowalevskii TaxID=10224 RepID=A0ABM0GMQ1_SACKO|nr:PREDICTED: vascular endothelial growth factor C [Saccoglossus kowalevskii]
MWQLVFSAAAILALAHGEYDAIPASILYKMRDVHSAEDFIRIFHRPKPPSGPGYHDEGPSGTDLPVVPVGPPGIPGLPSGNPYVPDVSGGGSDEVEHDDPYSIVADLPPCVPRLAMVPIPKDRDPAVFLWPPCVELHRCGGCCNNELFVCEATKTNSVDVKVYRTSFDQKNPEALPVEGIQTFRLTNETGCECSCKVKSDHCNLDIHRHENCQCVCKQPEKGVTCMERKVWDESTCSCLCKASMSDRICYPRKKMWDDSTCQCECKRTISCKEGYVWNIDKCRCERLKPFTVKHCPPTDCPLGRLLMPPTCECIQPRDV